LGISKEPQQPPSDAVAVKTSQLLWHIYFNGPKAAAEAEGKALEVDKLVKETTTN
jgi:hypothetical protein